LVLLGCSGSDAGLALAVDPTSDAAEEAQTDPGGSAAGGSDIEGTAQAARSRADLARRGNAWFESSLGLDALDALEQRDAEAARVALEALLAANPPARDAAGASILLARDAARRRDFETAASYFARARDDESLAPIRDWLVLEEARARLDAKDSAAALVLLEDLRVSSAWAPQHRLALADAKVRQSRVKDGIADYRTFLSTWPRHSAKREVQFKLAEALEEIDPDEAVLVHREVLLAAPHASSGDKSRAALETLRKRGHAGPKPKAFAERLALAEVEGWVDRREYTRAEKAADKLLKRGGLTAQATCEVAFSRATATFKRRKRAEARPHFERAATLCVKAKDDDRVVKSRYQAARGLYAEGRYDKAALAFEGAAKAFPKHSYADDAWVLAGESWESHLDAERAKDAWKKALAIGGDKLAEARRRLVLLAFAEGRDEDALALATPSETEARALDRFDRAKLAYFRGRALQRLGRDEDAVAEWLVAVDTMPLSYPALLALSRLKEVSKDGFATGLARLERSSGATADPRDDVLPTEIAARVEIFAALGLGDEARAELDAADVKGWSAVKVLAKAGVHEAAQRVLADLGTDWRAQPPVDEAWRERWELASPTPFASVISKGEPTHEVPPFLTFAIMQTESRFDPGATSYAGAKGLVQLMPSTAAGLARELELDVEGDRIYQPSLNLRLGMHYLGRLSGRFGGGEGGAALAIPSYNAGAGAVDGWIAKRGEWDFDLFIEAIPYDETRKYTQSVLERWMVYRWLYAEGTAEERLPLLPLETPKRVRKDGG
jgi:soluble lytic murein transglycosylase